jgi:spermidine synthase
MKPRELIASATVPNGLEELRLFRRGEDFMIVLDRNELMNSRMSGSEEALATLTCKGLKDRQDANVLIGGYGMGFTLRAALDLLPMSASVTVSEIVPEIVDWARGPMAHLTAGCLDDPRVQVALVDVAGLIRSRRGAYDAILLDVDNGPDGLTRTANDQLYSKDGLAAALTALRPGGRLGIWSASPDAAFTRRLRQSDFVVEEIIVRARSTGKGPRHVIWLADRS